MPLTKKEREKIIKHIDTQKRIADEEIGKRSFNIIFSDDFKDILKTYIDKIKKEIRKVV